MPSFHSRSELAAALGESPRRGGPQLRRGHWERAREQADVWGPAGLGMGL